MIGQDLLPTDSTVVNATHLLIYTVSSLVEQSTPALQLQLLSLSIAADSKSIPFNE